MKFYTNIIQRFNKFLVRGYEEGKRFSTTIPEYYPKLYVPSKNKETHTTLDGKYVKEIAPGTPEDCKEFIQKYKEVDGFEVYGMDNYIFQYISDNYPEEKIEYDFTKIKISVIDIEVSSENGFPSPLDCIEEILSISIQDLHTQKIICFGVKPYLNHNKNVKYILCQNEVDLCYKFLEYWKSDYPDIITGWNCALYDIPYIIGRFTRILGESKVKELSPWGRVVTKELEFSGRITIVCDIFGISVLDYLDLYKKFTYKTRESYALNHIGEVELNEKKLDHSEYETFKDFYTNDWNKFIDYNIQDVILVSKLENKLKLLEVAVMMAFNAKVNFADVFYQVRMWDAITYNYLKRRNIAIPPRNKVEKTKQFKGAYVKEPTPGMYDYVVSFDLASLYPSLIMMYNISPETIVEEKHPSISINGVLSKTVDTSGYPDYAICPNGCMYRKNFQGFFPELIEEMFDRRKYYKKQMLELEQEYEDNPTPELANKISEYHNIQQNLKICLNSLYGALGNCGFRYYRLDNATAVTFSGQTTIKWIENKLNGYLNKIIGTKNEDFVIALDTDSNYLNFGPLVNKFFGDKEVEKSKIIDFLDKICDGTFQEFINKSFDELAEYTNAYKNTLYMKREAICDRAIWTAKKRYILNVWDNEGVRYDEPKIKIKGLEAIKSSTPAVCRKMIKDAVPIMIAGTEDDMIDYIKKCKKMFMNLSPEEISFPRSVNKLDVYGNKTSIYKKGTPIQIRSVLLYNHYIRKNKLDTKYPIIQNGEKIKYCYLKLPNPIQENAIGFIQTFPKELDLADYVDYNMQYSKAFLDPLTHILDVIGWKAEKTVNLSNFYC
jgi:DNA polymerase elongation subunit (family B)